MKNAQSGEIPSLNPYVYGQLEFRIFSLSVKIVYFLLSRKILFLCVSRVNFPHFEILTPLSR